MKASNDASAKQKNAQDELSNALMENLLEPLKSNIRLFDMNLPFCDNLYPLDIAIHTNDGLLNSLVENGAFHYSSEFNPHISAKTGNFAKALELLRSNPVTDDSIIKVLTFIISLPDTEFYALLENKRSDLKRNGCILITYFEKLRLLVIMRDFFFRDKTPLKRAIESLLQARAFAKANYVFDRARELCLYIGEEDMLEASFRYGNIEYINRWDLWNLVNTITERFKYSHAFARLEYDSRGDILKFKWNFEPYVKPENIGNEMYHKIMDEIENHSSRYCI